MRFCRYVQEGSSVTVFGMLHRNNDMTTIVQPPEVISTGCLWRQLLLPVDIDGMILRSSQTPGILSTKVQYNRQKDIVGRTRFFWMITQFPFIVYTFN
ncbi:membrane protein [Pyrus ussuriensis x Pyrus communis]|uniref:Membrane protein n=1 Tax=Pyrus ussuriensis x Pyrus communis TaxID=2448454 RepID=A0A5N5F733_9ROSA|nr:membrane protein [Pyrus ussuriensis x Pyrus communis]